MNIREQIEKDIQPFVQAMIDELVRHSQEKGSSFKLGTYQIDTQTRYSSMPSHYKKVKMHEHLYDLLAINWRKIKEDPWSNIGEFVDHANFCFFLWWQLTNKPTTYAHNWGVDENADWIWEAINNQEKRS